MKAKLLSRTEALEYWKDPSQQLYGLKLEDLPEPDENFAYFGVTNLAALVHASFWPGIYMFHIGVKPEGRGNLKEESLLLLNYVTDYYNAELLTTWVPSINRAADAMAKRTGLDLDGKLNLKTMQIHMYSWTRKDNK